MGRGNVCATGPYEGVFYIDHDYTAVYRKVNAADDDMDDRKLRYWFGTDSPEEKGWEYDECESVDEEDYDLAKAMRHTTLLVALLPKWEMVLLSLLRAIRLTTCRSLLSP